MGERCFDQRYGAEHIDVETLAPTISRRRNASLGAGGRYHDINLTSLGCDCMDPRSNGGEVGGVNDRADRARTEGRLGCGHALRAARTERDVHSFGQETFNNAATDAAAGSSDKGGLAGKSEIHGNLLVIGGTGKE